MSNTKDTPMDYKQMYEHNPNSAESILNEKMSAISHAWLDDQRAAVIEAMKEHASNEVAKYKTVIEKLLLSAGYALHESIIDEAKKLIKP